MQTHTHLSGQVPGQVAGQMPSIPQQNMSSLPSQGLQSWRRTWQTEGDVGIRKLVIEKIMLLFQKRKSHVSQEWQQKLPDLVKRLEESLYRDAASRDEYADLSTLEQRLQAVARRMGSARNMPNYAHQGINMASSSTIGPMIPTPGVPLVTNSSTMVPTPGGDITTMPTSVTGSVVSNSGSMPNLVPSSMLFKGCAAPVGNPGSMIPTPGLNSKYFSVPLEPASVPGNSLVGQQGLGPLASPSNTQLMGSMDYSSTGSQMIPTPGLDSSQSIAANTNTSAEMNFSNIDSVAAIQQQLNDGPSGHIYRSMNAQFGGTVANSRQQKISPFRLANNVGFNNGMQLTGNRQLVNGNMKFSSSSGYGNSSHGSNVQMQHQHHFIQHHEQHSAMPVSSGGVTSMKNMSMNTMALQTSKMIPVPGLPQQSSFQAHQLQSQREPSEQVSLPHNSSGLSSSQHEQVQYLKSKGPFQAQLRSNVFGHKQPSIGSQHEDNRTGSDLMTFTIPDRSLLEQQQSLSMQSQHQHQQQLSQLSLLQHQSPLQMLPLHHEKEEEHQVQETQQTQSHLEQVWQQLPGKDQELENSFNQQLQHQKILKHEVDQDLCMETEPYQQNSVQQQISLRKIQEGQSYGESQQQPGDQENSNEKEKSNEMTANSAVVIGQTARKPLNAPNVTSMPGENVEGQRSQQYLKQQRWLLFLRHASRCTAPEGQCHTTPYCHNARQLWSHITKCTDRNCQYARCYASRTLLRHHQQCRDPKCPVCGPVRQILLQQRTQAQTGRGQLATSMPIPEVSTACKPINAPDLACTESSLNKSSTMLSSSTQGQQPPTKRAKMEPLTETVPQNVTVYTAKNQSIPDISPSQGQTVPPSGIKQEVSSAVIKEEANHIGSPLMKSELHSVPQSSSMSQRSLQVKTELSQNEAYLGFQQVHSTVNVKIEGSAAGVTKIAKQETISNASPANASDLSTAKSSKPKIKGVSLIELFTPEQIREHISGLRQWVGQSKSKAEKNQAMEHHMNENSCQLCAVERLTFEPPPIYCTSCGARIKRNASYWTVGSGETRQYFCIPCYNDIRSDTVELDGITYLKSKFEKKKNDEETEEAWVQCDKCEAWQHQVCALFNGRRNEGGQAEYTCPQCCIKEIERGERKPLPQSAVLGAKDLPKTLLSDHIEHRLARRMKQERLERARSQGKSFDEVPGAESLIVRVVSSVDKKLEVKQRFLEIFQEEDYPTEFAYKSKVLLLFQKIEGVEVCLYGMYIQEFGSECSQPNQRRVYLSYLDSVKYFRPEVKTVSGEALRTFVYHEILIAYLDYCKRRGFTSCYIWACPPLKGEDYILYCHPEIQKTPKADKLREWYLTMLRKAVNENIVAEVTNLHDHFFVSTGECKAKVTAARLPYFDGDYWPGAAEDMIMQLQQDEEDSSKSQKKSKIKKPPTKRASKVAAQAELTNNASKDLQLMHKLGESIYPMKEDFIMVHMQYACAICCNFILSGYRWACKQCKDFHICDQCYDTEQKLEERNRHPINSKEAHQFFPVEVSDVSADTKDKDEIMESEFFDTRQAFLSLCQGNHYQYDTLRRAKHSSMMVLYHLHNPTAPAFVTTCNFCHHDIETGQGWRCETCPDFDLCNVCYQKGDAVKHPHKLIPHPSLAERDAQSKEARQQRVLQLRKMLELLIHASQCFSSQCSYPNCRRVKGLFRHGINCKVRASGGCPLCKRMWYLLQLHARACKESECRVPRCKDLKEHLRRLQQQMESRRRAAVKEMMRQRAAEAAGISS